MGVDLGVSPGQAYAARRFDGYPFVRFPLRQGYQIDTISIQEISIDPFDQSYEV